jgi:hypothetical protein
MSKSGAGSSSIRAANSITCCWAPRCRLCRELLSGIWRPGVRRYVTALGVGTQSSRRKDSYRRLIWSIGARFSTRLSSSLICCVRSAGVHVALRRPLSLCSPVTCAVCIWPRLGFPAAQRFAARSNRRYAHRCAMRSAAGNSALLAPPGAGPACAS